MRETITRTAFDALPAAERADVASSGVSIVDETAAEREQRLSEARDKAIAEGGGKVILRGLFDRLDPQGRVDFLNQGGRVID